MEVAIAGAVRSPSGRFGGALRSLAMADLAVPVAQAALGRAGLSPMDVDEVVLAHRHQAGNGPNPARTVAVWAGAPERVPAATVNMACASGVFAIMHARRAILAEDAEIVLVIGADSMSTMPFYAPSMLRWSGVRAGDLTLADARRDGIDPLSGLAMGATAERLATRFGISRTAQDEWALRSHQRAADAWDSGRAGADVVAVVGGRVTLEQDETIRRDTSAERLAELAPIVSDDGTVTAGNASQMADGAAAVVVATPAALQRRAVEADVHIGAVSAVGVDPTVMGIGPTLAIPKVLERTGWTVQDVDQWEINEAFGAQIVQNVRALELDEDRVNVDGGAIALGHPTGQTGVRLTAALASRLAAGEAETGVVSLCVGGGQGVAMSLHRAAAG